MVIDVTDGEQDVWGDQDFWKEIDRKRNRNRQTIRLIVFGLVVGTVVYSLACISGMVY